MIITIDGPAGAGKSSTAKALARRLGFDYLDTGAMYRAVTLAVLRGGVGARDETALAQLVNRLELCVAGNRIVLDGEDVTDRIRTAEVTAASGAIADSPVVRRRLVDLQRQIAVGRNIVCEGRDQGTVAFPDAACKFFLVADAEERARRRLHDMESRGESIPYEDVLAAQTARDQRDAQRHIAPMVAAADAIIVDSTRLSLEEVVDQLEQHVRRCRPGSFLRGTSPPSGSAGRD
jgi:cytidylate kinase